MQQRQHQPWHSNIRWLALVVGLVAGCALAAEEGSDEDLLRIPLWNYSAELRGGLGYKDNVLLSHTNAQGSAFWMTSLEAMMFRLPTHGWQFHMFADASDVRYLGPSPVDDEQWALAAAQLGKDLGQGWKSLVGLNYLYQNQVFDYSTTYTNESSVGLILGHTLIPRWGVQKKLGPFRIETEIAGTRQWLESPLDDSWQLGPRAVGAYGWGRGSELVLVYQWSRLDYDHREQADLAGGAIPNTSLALNTHSTELSLTHVWDAKQRWRSLTNLGFESTLDNGSGFYGYDYYRVAQQIRYRCPKWEFSARASLGYYDYDRQTVSATDPTLRRRALVRLALRAEYALAKHLKAHASYGWDRSVSELDFDDYQASVVVGGLGVSF